MSNTTSSKAASTGTDLDARNLSEATSRTVKVNNRDYLFFGGTAYLGLNKNMAFTELILEGIRRYGINNGTSRSNNVQLGIYSEVEDYSAKKFGFEDAILVSSGYLAAQLAVRQMASMYAPEQIIYSPFSHPALWLDKSPTAASTFQDWAEKTVARINQSSAKQFLIISNSFDNIIPQLFDYSPFLEVDTDKELHFLLDDSHGLGMFHPDQSTVHDFFNTSGQNFKLTLVASMAKGLGIDAGLILGDRQTVAALRQTGVFIGASPSAPAFLHAFSQGEHTYQNQWRKLQENISFFRAGLRTKGTESEWKFIPDYPVFYRPDHPYADHLEAHGILVSSFPYPDPNDPPLDRIVISAAHEEEDLKKLLSLL